MPQFIVEIIERLKKLKFTDRKRASIFVSAKLWREFHALCEPVAPNRVLELWMYEALEREKRKRKK